MYNGEGSKVELYRVLHGFVLFVVFYVNHFILSVLNSPCKINPFDNIFTKDKKNPPYVVPHKDDLELLYSTVGNTLSQPAQAALLGYIRQPSSTGGGYRKTRRKSKKKNNKLKRKRHKSKKKNNKSKKRNNKSKRK